MHLRRRYLLLAVTFAAAAAPPAFGQAVPPTVGPAHGGKQSASVPELSGMWVHGSIPGFEPMPSGPTALINRSRRDGVGNILELVGDYTNPILKPWAAEVVKTFGRISASGVGFASPRNQCWPGGVPFVFTSGAIEILQQPDKVAILCMRERGFLPGGVRPEGNVKLTIKSYELARLAIRGEGHAANHFGTGRGSGQD